jgi:ABC transporter substrate binding protein
VTQNCHVPHAHLPTSGLGIYWLDASHRLHPEGMAPPLRSFEQHSIQIGGDRTAHLSGRIRSRRKVIGHNDHPGIGHSGTTAHNHRRILVRPSIACEIDYHLHCDIEAAPGAWTDVQPCRLPQIVPKLLEFLGVLFPRAITLAALYNPANPSSVNFLPSLRRESSVRGISLIELAFASSADLGSTLSTLVAARHLDALQLLADSFVFDQADRIAALALAQRLPTLASAAEIAYAGALLAYGLSVKELYRRSAYYVKRILDEGANPADLPVEQPTRVGLVINLKTAKALGVDVPEQLLARADEVIE